jgi:hypothetical protein
MLKDKIKIINDEYLANVKYPKTVVCCDCGKRKSYEKMYSRSQGTWEWTWNQCKECFILSRKANKRAYIRQYTANLDIDKKEKILAQKKAKRIQKAKEEGRKYKGYHVKEFNDKGQKKCASCGEFHDKSDFPTYAGYEYPICKSCKILNNRHNLAKREIKEGKTTDRDYTRDWRHIGKLTINTLLKEDNLKYCNKCNTVKSIEDFTTNNNVSASCSACRHEKNKAYWKDIVDNRPEFRNRRNKLQNQKYWENPEKYREYNRKSVKSRQEDHNQKRRNRYQKNIDRERERVKLWWENLPIEERKIRSKKYHEKCKEAVKLKDRQHVKEITDRYCKILIAGYHRRRGVNLPFEYIPIELVELKREIIKQNRRKVK